MCWKQIKHKKNENRCKIFKKFCLFLFQAVSRYEYLTLSFFGCFQGGRGKFLYAHSAVQREGDIAKVTIRRQFPASIGRCHLRFWFYMHGSDRMGTLKVT